MSISKQSRKNLKKAVEEMIKHFTTAESIVTDFHFQVNNESGTLTIFDDDDNELTHTHIEEWENLQSENCNEIFEEEIRKILVEQQKEGALDNMNIPKPYSCLLVDEDKETIVDLLYVDDETVIIDNELLKGLDEELNDFLRHLLEE